MPRPIVVVIVVVVVAVACTAGVACARPDAAPQQPVSAPGAKPVDDCFNVPPSLAVRAGRETEDAFQAALAAGGWKIARLDALQAGDPRPAKVDAPSISAPVDVALAKALEAADAQHAVVVTQDVRSVRINGVTGTMFTCERDPCELELVANEKDDLFVLARLPHTTKDLGAARRCGCEPQSWGSPIPQPPPPPKVLFVPLGVKGVAVVPYDVTSFSFTRPLCPLVGSPPG